MKRYLEKEQFEYSSRVFDNLVTFLSLPNFAFILLSIIVPKN